MEFMRAVSILFLVIHVYWYCYQAFSDMGISIGIVDKILLNFQRTAGLFRSLLLTKVFALIFLALSCLGTKGVKNRDMTWNKIYAFFLGGLVLFFMNWWMLELPVSSIAKAGLYTATLTTGYILMLMAGVWVSRMLKNDLMDDVFNMENESFMQNTVLMENEYSVNLAHQVRVPEERMGRLDQYRQSFQGHYRVGHSRIGKEFRGGKQLYQTADIQRVRCIYL